MMKCVDDVDRAFPMYAERGAFFDSAVSAQRNDCFRAD